VTYCNLTSSFQAFMQSGRIYSRRWNDISAERRTVWLLAYFVERNSSSVYTYRLSLYTV